MAKINIRRTALNILQRVEKGAYASPILSSKAKKLHLSKRDRGFLNELVYGVLKNRLYLDYILKNFTDKDWNDLKPTVKNPLRMGLYQIIFMDVPDYACVSTTVSLMPHKGLRMFANGILRAAVRGWREVELPDISTDHIEHISIKTSHPRWLVTKWVDILGVEETECLCRANNEQAPLSLRINSIKTDINTLIKELNDELIEVEHSEIAPDGMVVIKDAGKLFKTSAFKRGLFYIQDISTQLPPLLLNPSNTDKICDICCGLGGKTSYLAELTDDDGDITAVDINESKIKKLRENTKRLGLNSIKPLTIDILTTDIGEYDAILLDVPCSNSGVFRRRPEVKYRLSEEDITDLTTLQYELLEKAWSYLKKGGRLVYSSCSLLPEENIGVIERFTDKREDVEFIDPRRYLSGLYKSFPDTSFERGTTLYPHTHNTDGAFYISLKKV